MFGFLDKFGSVFSLNFILMLIFIGIFLVLWDAKKLKQDNLLKEYKIAKTLGYTYFFVGIAFYIAGKIYK